MHIKDYITTLGKQAKAAAQTLASTSTASKNNALKAIKASLLANQAHILAANAKDVQAGFSSNLDAALLDRLALDDKRFASMLTGLDDVIGLADPVGEITDMTYRPSGIQLGKMRVPLGVVGMIYESRPNVTLEAASLALKSGNAIILRGGSEAQHSNQAIAESISQGLSQAGLPSAAVQVVNTTDRAAVGALITLRDYVDVIIPRGGKGLIARISEEARIPVIKHLDGNCHVYVDVTADLNKALNIAFNAKTHRYGVCNAMETLLVHSSVASELLSKLGPMYAEKGVEIRGCPRTVAILPNINTANESDWYEEYLAPIVAIKVVDNIDQAIAHINTYGSHHTDALVSEDYTLARKFMAAVDSSSVMINASTRFADGFEYGLGAEIGISTDKIHARGPVGLHGLTSQKWVVWGDGHIRQ